MAEEFAGLAKAKGDGANVKSIIVKHVGDHEYNDPRHTVYTDIKSQINTLFEIDDE